MGEYVLKSIKAIEFYNKNPHFDFNNMNEIFVDIITKLTTSMQTTITVNEIKTLLYQINHKVEKVDENVTTNNTMVKMLNDNLNNNRNYYISSVKEIIEKNQENNEVLKLIRETNEVLIEKTICSIIQQFPKLNENMTKEIKQIMDILKSEVVEETQRNFNEIQNKESNLNLEKVIQDNYENINNKIHNTIFGFIQNQESSVMNKLNDTQKSFQNMEQNLNSFLEKQKNSTLKGKESEEKLELCLNQAFPYGEIVCQSGQPHCCDYLLRRQDKPDILFENKDYSNNVPHEEIKKFIRDVEYQKKHSILLSQHSGVTQKMNYQIDIHDGNIMIYIHYVNYDTTKIQVAVNLIDHLYKLLEKHDNNNELHISMDELSEINKEYLTFIGQKKSLIETTKKMHKDQLKALEDFEMPKLTLLLNSKFTNVEQLSYKCEICGVYSAKNKRALITHQNKCKKNKQKNEIIDLENSVEN
jgi:hypothetical protein